MTDPTPLSPQAQAVLDAVEDDCIHPSDKHRLVAAALRAVVEHLAESHAGFDLADQYGQFVEAGDILAIAAELDGTNTSANIYDAGKT